VTFEEARAHLGVETQRQWSDLAIARTTPVIFGLFSVVTLMADRLIRSEVKPVRTAAWYGKQVLSFADAIAIVRRCLWGGCHFSTSGKNYEFGQKNGVVSRSSLADQRLDSVYKPLYFRTNARLRPNLPAVDFPPSLHTRQLWWQPAGKSAPVRPTRNLALILKDFQFQTVTRSA